MFKDKPDYAIIENTQAARKEFGLGCWNCEYTLTGDQINALLNGKCLAIQADCEAFFITRDDAAKGKN